ncbi:2-amino-4-hydroxy-6-hydroxymethyldihydropteridine diphosphokinase [Yoonia maricola]|uniref:2-amino-4-hydroxy-6-hydroxymethyldihydropteridine pyrophosphokinase n=1 Tax=Yoonia maricola TaxID=420999 RepID=A0A2M8WPT0_9RHOB|nr:2-amino-4-hydroxy-6-hydroxymethyldihydropteridine diphosphokinase [Yoonia maricola]PJI92938.1 2-amino-4-hydroxy-6-hydroxymethyldihydropteridine diphosphokinase [Yoonia maricola]
MSQVSQHALIALGSNENSAWGDAKETVQKAMHLIAAQSSGGAQISGLFSTPAFPAGTGPVYINAAMAIETALSPTDLLDILHEIEAKAGRKRIKRWGQRSLDLDLIALGACVFPNAQTHQTWRNLPLHDQQVMSPKELILPHPRLQDRAFVLVPMLDIAPDWEHPILRRTIAQLCADLPAELRAEATRLSDPDSL